ncbi:hypothetical protein BMS3Bbin11_00252 [bacterium BMS3Bbin11]|nr:hypothetical protein BMS3Abin11_00808 [bacterium BMS3Abin11]GBE45172.1 hypothetical protein BMS3Bbin11_00252 [bacterium BMS3Bbin11]HDH15799.1 hypothetical protein [Gammaproteobacteria bacterium]
MFKDARTSLEIRVATDSRWKIRLMSVLVAVLFVTVIAAYAFGKYRAEVEWQQAIEALDVLESDFTSVALENDKLKESLAFEKAKSRRDLQIKRQAYEEVAQTLISTSREIASLRENIRFYESIIEGNEHKQGLQIKTVSLQSDGTVGNYRYRVIIVNSDYGKKKSKGKLLIEVEGLMEGDLKTIKVPTGSAGKDAKLLFKYLQRVDGLVTIPEGFLPQRLHLTARLSGKKTEKKEKWYNWNILLNKGLPEQS